MNGKDIFQSLQYVGMDLIDEAEFAPFPGAEHARSHRPLLLAALVALLLMLVGCAVVYVLGIQSMKIGTVTESLPVFSGKNLDITGYEDVEMQVLTLAGLKGSPNYQAAQEWYQFQAQYDPDMALYFQLYEAGTLEEYPPEFGGTPIYTPEMRAAIDSILSKYHLLPPGEPLNFRTLKNLCAALGIEKIQTAQNAIGIQITHGTCSSNGNFLLTMQFSLPEDRESQFCTTWGNLFWNRKDCFTSEYTTIEACSDWKEWNYTTASGSKVLIFRSPSDSRGWIVCQREEAQMVLQLETMKELPRNSQMEYQHLTDRQLEMIADAIDFSIQPNRVTQEDVKNQPPYIPGTAQNGWNVTLKSVKTDGYMLQILMGITAPDHMDITHVEASDDRSYFFDIYPGNDLEYFTPQQGETNGANWSWYPLGDGDGLDNTQDFIMTYNTAMMDGSAPFAEGSVWNLQIEDLMHHRRDSQKMETSSILLTEGEWNFTIPFGPENGFYQRADLLREPMTLPVITGWDEDGSDVWSTSEVQSIELHPMSVHFIAKQGERDYGWVNVVMKDGSRIPFSPVNFNSRCVYEATKWIDLHQASYLLLQDGTRIPIPENGIQ